MTKELDIFIKNEKQLDKFLATLKMSNVAATPKGDTKQTYLNKNTQSIRITFLQCSATISRTLAGLIASHATQFKTLAFKFNVAPKSDDAIDALVNAVSQCENLEKISLEVGNIDSIEPPANLYQLLWYASNTVAFTYWPRHFSPQLFADTIIPQLRCTTFKAHFFECDISPNFLPAIESNPLIKEVALTGSPLNVDVEDKLNAFVALFNRITSIRLANLTLPSEAKQFQRLVTAIKHSPSLNTLDLSEVPLSIQQLSALAEAIAHNKTLTKFVLDSVTLSGMTGDAEQASSNVCIHNIATALSNSALKKLALSICIHTSDLNIITDAENRFMQTIIRGLANHQTIQELTLHLRGMTHLACYDTIAAMPCLTTFEQSEIGIIPDEAKAAITTALRKSASLTTVTMGFPLPHVLSTQLQRNHEKKIGKTPAGKVPSLAQLAWGALLASKPDLPPLHYSESQRDIGPAAANISTLTASGYRVEIVRLMLQQVIDTATYRIWEPQPYVWGKACPDDNGPGVFTQVRAWISDTAGLVVNSNADYHSDSRTIFRRNPSRLHLPQQFGLTKSDENPPPGKLTDYPTDDGIVYTTIIVSDDEEQQVAAPSLMSRK